MSDEREKRLGKYLLKSRLGQGGMGVVYLATDLRLKRDVALKILPRSMSKDALAAKRFLREARVAAQLSHPHVVTIHDVDQQQGLCFLVMELLTGGTAHDLLVNGPLDWREATRIIADICRGLSAIHHIGMIHRDIKPSNIMRAGNGTVKLADFGLVKLTGDVETTGGLTQSNAILGTPQYMSPEQCQGEPLDPRSDLYSLGATYYALLTGEAPYSDSQALQVMFAHCSKPVPDPRAVRGDVPAECAAVVMRAMAKSRAERFATADAMLAALVGCLSGADAESTVPGSGALDRSVASGKSRVSEGFEDADTNAGSVRHVAGVGSDPGPTVLGSVARDRSVVSGTTRVSEGFVKADANAGSVRHVGGVDAGGFRDVRRAIPIAVGCVLLLFVVWGGSHYLTGRGNLDQKTVGASNPKSEGKRRPTSGGSARPLVARQGNGPITLEFEAEVVQGAAQMAGAVFSNDGQTFFSASLDGDVRQWDVATRKVVKQYSGGQGGMRAVAAHDPWLAAGGKARTVWVWNRDSADSPIALDGFRDDIRALSFSPDGRRLAVGGYGDARLYAMEDNGPRLIKELGTSTSGEVKCYMVHSVAFSADSRWVAAATWESKAAAVWDADTGALRVVRRHFKEDPMAVAFLPGADRLLVGMEQAGLYQWDLESQDLELVPHTTGINLRTLVVTADGGSAIIVGEWDGKVRVYDLRSGTPPRALTHTTGTGTLGISMSADETRLLTAGGEADHKKGFIHLWKILPESSR